MVCGVIGAVATLGVVLGAELLIMLVRGLRLVNKMELQHLSTNGVETDGLNKLAV